MKLPHMKYGDNITKQTQIAFGGYNHTPNAKDGEIYDMQNISSDLYPLITQRNKRDIIGNINAFLYKSKRFWFGNENDVGKLVIKELDGSGWYIKDMLEKNDIIELFVDGKYLQNSGEYVVTKITGDDDTGHINITLSKEFKTIHTTTDYIELPVNDDVLSIRIKKRVGECVTTTESEEEYVDNSFETVNKTEYSIDDKLTAVNTVVSSQNAYKKTAAVTVNRLEKADSFWEATDIFAYSRSDNEVRIHKNGNSFVYDTYYCYRVTALFDNYKLVYLSYSVNTSGSHYIDIKLNDSKWAATIGSSNKFTLRIEGYNKVEQLSKNSNYSYQLESEKSTTKEVNFDELIETMTEITSNDAYKKTTTVTTREYELCDYQVNIASINAEEKMYFVTDQGHFYYDRVYCANLTVGEKQFTQTGNYIYILPDNCYYNIRSGMLVEKKCVELDAYNYLAGFNGIRITNRDEMDVSMFKTGDVVTVKALAQNGETYIFENATISEVSEDGDITFTENLIERDYLAEKITSNELEKLTGYDGIWGWYEIELTQGFPKLNYICADSNRIWGCDDKTIYCTSFGNPFGWYEYDVSQAGNDADSAWTIEPFDSEGDFTGCCIYNDRPMFFKENKIYKVYGSKASDFQLSSEDTPGVSKGSAESICVIDSILYYLSPEGVMRYSGNYGTCISDEFYDSFENAVGGSDGVHYFITMQSGDEWKTFTYNTKKRLWCIEDDKRVKRYFDFERNVFRHDFDGQIQCINPSSAEYPELFGEVEKESDFDSFIEFGDFYVDVINKKIPSKLYFRFLVEDSVEILINYDSEEQDGQRVWESVKKIEADTKKSIIVPMIPKRCDHFRIKIKGRGNWTLYTMSYEYYVGTEL